MLSFILIFTNQGYKVNNPRHLRLKSRLEVRSTFMRNLKFVTDRYRAATCPALGWTSSFGRFVLPSPALTHLSSPSHFCPALGHFTWFLFFILGIFNKKSILTKGLDCLCIIGYFCPKKIFKFDSKVTEMISKTHKFLNKREYQKVLLS